MASRLKRLPLHLVKPPIQKHFIVGIKNPLCAILHPIHAEDIKVLTHFQPRDLLDKPVPSSRAAYSDRTAWLMAELSKLAYLRFEGDLTHLVKDMAVDMLKLKNETLIERHLLKN